MPVCSYDSHGLGKRTDRVAGWTELGLHWEAFLGSAVWGGALFLVVSFATMAPEETTGCQGCGLSCYRWGAPWGGLGRSRSRSCTGQVAKCPSIGNLNVCLAFLCD